MHSAVRSLTRDETFTVTVKGECMLPWIENGTPLHITQARFYWPGDVVVALSRNGHYLVHRVIGVYHRQGGVRLLTQADSALLPDISISSSDILGKVTGGGCHPYVISVPFSHRLKALLRFAHFSVAHVSKAYRAINRR